MQLNLETTRGFPKQPQRAWRSGIELTTTSSNSSSFPCRRAPSFPGIAQPAPSFDPIEWGD